jgi:hypothetical protein
LGGGGWQCRDDPRYPRYLANLGITFGVYIVVHAMTH